MKTREELEREIKQLKEEIWRLEDLFDSKVLIDTVSEYRNIKEVKKVLNDLNVKLMIYQIHLTGMKK